MVRPYSEDLRERALLRYDGGETTRSIATALRIAPSCVSKWLKLRRETGSLTPGQMGAAPVRRDSGVAGCALPVRAVHDARSDGGACRARHQDRSASRLGVPARRRAQLQKKPCCPPSKRAPTSLVSACAGKRIKVGSTHGALSSSTKPG